MSNSARPRCYRGMVIACQSAAARTSPVWQPPLSEGERLATSLFTFKIEAAKRHSISQSASPFCRLNQSKLKTTSWRQSLKIVSFFFILVSLCCCLLFHLQLPFYSYSKTKNVFKTTYIEQYISIYDRVYNQSTWTWSVYCTYTQIQLLRHYSTFNRVSYHLYGTMKQTIAKLIKPNKKTITTYIRITAMFKRVACKKNSVRGSENPWNTKWLLKKQQHKTNIFTKHYNRFG